MSIATLYARLDYKHPLRPLSVRPKRSRRENAAQDEGTFGRPWEREHCRTDCPKNPEFCTTFPGEQTWFSAAPDSAHDRHDLLKKLDGLPIEDARTSGACRDVRARHRRVPGGGSASLASSR
jgi:hypothetical protein